MAQYENVGAIHRLVWIALMAALLAAGAICAISIGSVPISLQTLFVVLTGLVLGPREGAYAVLLYLAAGSVGLPVFAGGKAGLGVLLGPTGGYLLGFIPSVMLASLGRGAHKALWKAVLCCFLATLVTLAIGGTRLAFVLEVTAEKAFFVGVLPFLPGALGKSLAAVAIYRFLFSRKLILS